MNYKVLIVIGFLLAVGAILFFNWKRDTKGSATESPAGTASTPRSKDAVEVTFLYSTEKKDWIEEETALFSKEHPEIQIKLTGRGSLEAAQELVDGKEKPTLWSPADSLVMSLGAADFETKNSARLVAAEGTEDAPQALVITPVVFVVWEDRAQVLSKGKGQISWKLIHDAVTANQGWPAIGGKAEWGFVKLGHTDPTRSNSGLQSLLLMTLEYYRKTSGLEVAELLKPDYQSWVKEIEKGVTKFESSTGTFMTDMVRFGPSKYDIAVVYESLAIAQIENAQGRWGDLRVYYPGTTVWSDHPVALLQGSWVTEAQRKAARSYVGYLKSRHAQERALGYGFRPADTSVPLKTADARNPFTRLAQYGVQIDIPPAA
ncbi:MAG TPA: substrate-binding domain-containing protein, partial [Myxococcaceae bacterium]|nr:substrate-binding domain-containing protein [Myxococcaceae bacterium]